jgi:hypothetical protein
MDNVPLPRVMTLEEAARALSERTSRTWSVRDVIASAERGEISVLAPWKAAVRLRRSPPRPSEQNELTTVVDCWSPIPQASALSLLVTMKRASLSGIPGLVPNPFAALGAEPQYVHGLEWVLADGQVAPQFDDCRVYNHAVDQLMDKYGAESSAHVQPIAARRRKKLDTDADAIMAILQKYSLDPTSFQPGLRSEAKAKAFEQLVPKTMTESAFDRAWTEVRARAREAAGSLRT